MQASRLSRVWSRQPTRISFGFIFCGNMIFPFEEMRRTRGIVRICATWNFLFVHHYVIYTNAPKRKYRQWYFKGWPFRAQVEHSIPPNLLSLLCTPPSSSPFVRQGLRILHLFANLSTLSLLSFNHNFHSARPHFHILVAFELDQRQDGSTFLFSS